MNKGTGRLDYPKCLKAWMYSIFNSNTREFKVEIEERVVDQSPKVKNDLLLL